MPDHAVKIELSQIENYQFRVDFGHGATLLADEAPPLGGGLGPDPVQLLAAAVGNCLSASLLFALRKFKQDAGHIDTVVNAAVGKNAANRVRVLGLDARITLACRGDSIEHGERIFGQFEDFCTVTQSVRGGIPVTVRVLDQDGVELHVGV